MVEKIVISGSLLQRDDVARQHTRKMSEKMKSIQEVIDSTSKEIEAVFVGPKTKVAGRAKAA